MKYAYSTEDVKHINNIAEGILLINGLNDSLLSKECLTKSIVQLGSCTSDKLFLLEKVLDDVIDKNQLSEPAQTISSASMAVIDTLHELFHHFNDDYAIKVLELPGLKLPCSDLKQAKDMAKALSFDATILYNDQVVFSSYELG